MLCLPAVILSEAKRSRRTWPTNTIKLTKHPPSFVFNPFPAPLNKTSGNSLPVSLPISPQVYPGGHLLPPIHWWVTFFPHVSRGAFTFPPQFIARVTFPLSFLRRQESMFSLVTCHGVAGKVLQKTAGARSQLAIQRLSAPAFCSVAENCQVK